MSTTAVYGHGKTEQSEIISTVRAIYVKMHAAWHCSPITAKDIKVQQEAADLVTRNYTCTRVGTATLNGVSTTRYHVKGRIERRGGHLNRRESHERQLATPSSEDLAQISGLETGCRGLSVQRHQHNVSSPRR